MKKILLFALAALLLVAFTAPAMAATKKVSFYGDIRFNTYWAHKDKDKYNNGLGDKDNDLYWQPDTADSRFGARFAEGPITANVELRPRISVSHKSSADTGYQEFWRQWWGSWNFGPASLLIGFTYTPMCIAYSQSQIESEDMVIYGNFMDELRAFQMKLTVPFSLGKFTLGLVEPPQVNQPARYGSVDNGSGSTLPTNNDYDYKIPKIEARLDFSINPAQITLIGGYYTFDFVDKDTEHSESVDSYMYGGRVIAPFGPFNVKGHLVLGQNPGNWGDLSSVLLHYRNMYYDPSTGKTENADYISYGALVGYKINDVIEVEAGYNYQKTERYQSEEDENYGYYIVMPIRPIKGVTIYPEIGVLDDSDRSDSSGAKTKQGKTTYYGAYWKISF